MKPQNSIHPTAKIGAGSKVWHWSVVLADVVIGGDCSIGSCCEIGRGTTIGDGTRIGFGSFLPPHSRVGKNVFIGPRVVCCDDRFPRVNNPHYMAEPPIIEDGANLGAGVVLLPGVRIGAGALVGAGSVVTRDVPPNTVVHGEAARARRLVG